MIRLIPSKRLIGLTTVLVGVGVASAFLGMAIYFWWMILGALSLAVILDARQLWATPKPKAERIVVHSWSIGRKSEVRWRISCAADRSMVFLLYDHFPYRFVVEHLPIYGTLTPKKESEFSYWLRPKVRGDFVFNGADIRLLGAFGLLWRQIHLPTIDAVKVFPDFKRLAGYAMNLGDNPLLLRGVRRSPKRGEGLEFQQLREYHPGDSLRQIDWKATAKHHKIISREYQEQRDQTIVFLMDCGRRLRAEDELGTFFDLALDSVLLLTYIALRQGDAVGFTAFNGDDRALAPTKGTQALHALLNKIYDLKPSPATFDFLTAASRLINARTKRSLVIVVTRIDAEDRQDLIAGARLLSIHHLVLLVTLREKGADSLLDTDVTTLDQALNYGASRQYHDERMQTLEHIRHEGVLLLDVTPAELPLALVGRYAEIKRAGLL